MTLVWSIKLSMVRNFNIVWHVYNLKLLHKDPKVVSEMIVCLKVLYEKLPIGEVELVEEQRPTLSN